MSKLIITVLCLYLLLAALLFIFQRSLLYFPTPNYQHDFEYINMENDGQTINVIVVNAGNDKAIMYFGGNAEAVIASAQEFRASFPTTSVYLVNYRGYGASTGKPTEKALFSDALAIYDHIVTKHNNIAVIGRSLGSGVATFLAANRPVSGVALVTPFDSIAEVAKNQFPIFPISWLLKDKFDSIALSKKITVPVLIIAAENDSIIPLKHSERLYGSFKNGNAKMSIIKQAQHNNVSQFPEYYPHLTNFLKDNL